MKLNPKTTEALHEMQISSFTEVQENVIPHAVHHEDVFALSPTGSGKTLAYVIGILEQIEVQQSKKHLPQAIILSPTRELSIQIAQVIRAMLKNREGIRTAVLTGGIDIQKQIRSFHNGADIIVGTPNRIKDHLRRHTLKTRQCRILVFDEADEMLSMGFEEDLEDIIEYLDEHQTMLFCATFNAKAESLARKILKQPFIYQKQKKKILMKDPDVIIANGIKDKIRALEKILRMNDKAVMIFANTRKTCDLITTALQKKKLFDRYDPFRNGLYEKKKDHGILSKP